MKQTTIGSALVLLAFVEFAHAEVPILQTASPVIHLADNLDEKDALGWCIDTLGRGFGERLHAHSCKPTGGDVQFQFETDNGLIRSVAFSEYCMTVSPNDQTTFALDTCDATDSTQAFAYDTDTGWIRAVSDNTQCLAVGGESRSAGPFMSRELLFLPCADTPEQFIEWVVLQ